MSQYSIIYYIIIHLLCIYNLWLLYVFIIWHYLSRSTSSGLWFVASHHGYLIYSFRTPHHSAVTAVHRTEAYAGHIWWWASYPASIWSSQSVHRRATLVRGGRSNWTLASAGICHTSMSWQRYQVELLCQIISTVDSSSSKVFSNFRL